MLLEIIIIFGACLFLNVYCTGSNSELLRNFAFLCDAPTLICIVLLSLPLLLRKGMWKDFLRAVSMQRKNRYIFSRKDGKLTFGKETIVYSLAQMKRSLDAVEFMQKQILYSGILIVILPLIYILTQLTEPEAIGPNMAVTLLSVLYTAVLELLLLPLQIDIKRRIINYMEEE